MNPGDLMRDRQGGLNRADLIGWGIVLVAVITRILMHGWSAYVWPTPDGFPYFEGLSDPALASRDFFTAASIHPNPRHVLYGLVEGLGSLFGVGYYQVLFTLWMLIAALLPPLLYSLLLRAGDARRRHPAGRILLAVAVGLWATIYDHRFAVGSWMPLPADATAQGLSLLIGLPMLLLGWHRGRWRRPLLWGLLLLAALLHPSNALALAVVGLACWPRGERMVDREWGLDAILLAVSWLIAVGSLWWLYGSRLDMPGEAFVDMYAHRSQPHHYAVGHLLVQYKTWLNILAMLTIGGFALLRLRSSEADARRMAWTLVLLCPGLLVLQWIAVDVVAHTQLVMLGPMRLFMILPWLAVALLPWLLPTVGEARPLLPWWSPWPVALLIFVVAGLRPADDAIDRVPEPRVRVLAWLAANSEAGAMVFSNSPSMESAIRHFLHRPVLLGKNFPFTPAMMSPYDRRLALQKQFERDPRAGAAALTEAFDLRWIVVKGEADPGWRRVYSGADGRWSIYHRPVAAPPAGR